jgi:hypothetical protein
MPVRSSITRDRNPMPTSRPPMDRLRPLLLGAAYCLSAVVLILQMLSFRGSRFGYVLLIALHAGIFWFVIFKSKTSSRLGLWCLLLAAAGAVGSIPFRPTLMAASALISGNSYPFSSLTRNMPIQFRALYEIGLFPVVQVAIMFVATHLWREAKQKG